MDERVTRWMTGGERAIPSSCELFRTGADELQRRGYALVLADARGVVVGAKGTEALPLPLRGRFAPGVHWDETASGTNAIGTALAEETPVTVIGRAHSDRDSHGLVCYAALIRDAQGNVIAVLDASGPVAVRDPLVGITVQSLAAALEGELRARALQELDGQLRRSDTLIAAVGHDLRNPLAAVLSGADLMISRSGDPRHRALAERIRSSGRRMHHLVDQLSDVSRARLMGTVGLDVRENVNLATLVERTVAELQLSFAERRIAVNVDGDPRGHWDAARLEQVISNLVGNALRHGEAAEPVGVTIDGGHPDRIFLAVTNTGEVERSVLPYLFEPFHPSKGRHKPREGLGLGLYIVEQIVSAHQGRVDVSSEHGTTTFCVELPRRV